jgi:hypothetical protein
MGALTRQIGSVARLGTWQAEVASLVDEHHLVAWSAAPRHRVQFTSSLVQFLGGIHDAEVCPLYGQSIRDLESFCSQLERVLPGPDLARRLDGPGGVTSLMRHRDHIKGRRAAKYRYYVWSDADVLLREDQSLFSRLVDILAGVSAESEYASDDLLLIHRAILVGGPILDVYGEDERGQFHRWYPDAEGEPFWELVAGVKQPRYLRFQIDQLNQ